MVSISYFVKRNSRYHSTSSSSQRIWSAAVRSSSLSEMILPRHLFGKLGYDHGTDAVGVMGRIKLDEVGTDQDTGAVLNEAGGLPAS